MPYGLPSSPTDGQEAVGTNDISYVYSAALAAWTAKYGLGTLDISDGGVLTIDVANAAVTTAKIADAAVTVPKLGADTLTLINSFATSALPRDGSLPMLADLSHGGHKSVSMADGVAAGDGATVGQMTTALAAKQAAHARLTDLAGIAWVQGDIAYFNGTALVRLAPGTSGQVLQTAGAAANPAWATSVSSQWTTNGANIGYTAGSVGVGTTSPGSQIEALLGTPGADTWHIVSKCATLGRRIGFVWISGGNEARLQADSVLALRAAGRIDIEPSGGSGSGVAYANGKLAAGATSASGAPGDKFAVNGGAAIGASYFQTAPPANGLLVQGTLGLGTSSPSAALDNAGDTYRQRTSRTPASAAAAGNAGDICWDADFLYVCVATNTWKRSLFTTW